jgi:predicted RNA-binding Zn-ribbon protein involved in translation (DUF1610 family)
VRSYKGRNFQVEQNCPQCGAPVVITENDRLFSCDYCRVSLYILSKDYFRYYLSPSHASSENILYVPYWRFRGTYYSLKPFAVNNRVVDTSFRASNHTFLPDSLGLRSQTLKLRFATKKETGNFLHPQVPFSNVLSSIEKISRTTDSLTTPGKVFHTAFIGETVSMIYLPVYLKGKAIFDGILNRPLARLSDIRSEMLQTSDNHKHWKLKYISSLCPSCGWDLTGGKESLALFCNNCSIALQVSNGSFKKLRFGVSPSQNKHVTYFPFWRMKVNINGINANSYADLIRIANLPKAVKKEWEEKELFFWSPAFKTNPRLFLRLSKQLTLLQPSEDLDGSLEQLSLQPATLNVEEAFESVTVTLGNISAAKHKIFPLLSKAEIERKQSLLVFFPFTVKGNEYVHADKNLSIQRSAVLSN